MACPPSAWAGIIFIRPSAHARAASIAWRGRGSADTSSSKRCSTCSAQAAAQRASSWCLASVSVPPRRNVTRRWSRTLGRITRSCMPARNTATCRSHVRPRIPVRSPIRERNGPQLGGRTRYASGRGPPHRTGRRALPPDQACRPAPVMSADTRLEELGVSGLGDVDEPAFSGLAERHRRELHVHLSRIDQGRSLTGHRAPAQGQLVLLTVPITQPAESASAGEQ